MIVKVIGLGWKIFQTFIQKWFVSGVDNELSVFCINKKWKQVFSDM